jgi:hypothetical protein
MDMMDVIDANAEDVRFLQATRHGEVLTPVALLEGYTPYLGEHTVGMLDRLRGAPRSAPRSSTRAYQWKSVGNCSATTSAKNSLIRSIAITYWTLFFASFAGFAVAILGIVRIPKMRALALREARERVRRVLTDFGSRALSNFELSTLHLFALAQIAGYAFIQREVDKQYTPVQWIKEMTRFCSRCWSSSPL